MNDFINTKVIIAAIFVIISVIAYYIRTVNYFKTQHQEIEKKRSGIEIALTNRYDALVKLNKTVVGYTGHESDVFTKVTKVRKGMDTEQLSDVEGQLSDAFSQIVATAESYPDLKASTNFLQMQDVICDLENTLQATRRNYNQAVSEYNSKAEMIPSCYIAKRQNVQLEKYFEAEERKKADVELEF